MNGLDCCNDVVIEVASNDVLACNDVNGEVPRCLSSVVLWQKRQRALVVVRLLQRVKSSKDADTDRNIKGIVWHF